MLIVGAVVRCFCCSAIYMLVSFIVLISCDLESWCKWQDARILFTRTRDLLDQIAGGLKGITDTRMDVEGKSL